MKFALRGHTQSGWPAEGIPNSDKLTDPMADLVATFDG